MKKPKHWDKMKLRREIEFFLHKAISKLDNTWDLIQWDTVMQNLQSQLQVLDDKMQVP